MALREGVADETEAATPPAGRFGAFSYREFRLLWFGLLVSNTGSWMASLAQGWLVVELSPTQAVAPFYLGLVGFVRAIPVVLLSGLAGTLADRVDRRRILVVAQVALALSTLALAVLSQLHVVRIWHVLVLAAVSAAASSFDAPTRQSMVPLLVAPRHLMNAIGLNSAAFNGPAIVGPAFAGIVVGWIGVAACFYLNALSYVAVLVALLLMSPKPPLATAGSHSIWHDLLEGVRYIRNQPGILAIFALAMLLALVARPYIQLLPAFVRTVMHGGPQTLGVTMAASGAGALIGSVTTALIGLQQRRGILLLVSGAATGVFLATFALSHEIVLALLSLSGLGIAVMLFMGMTNTLLQIYTPLNIRGRVMALYTMVFLGFMPFGSWLLGTAASLSSLPRTFVVCGALVLIATALVAVTKALPESASAPAPDQQ